MLLILYLLILGVGGESVHDISRERIIKKERIPQDLPELSEWNHEDPECKFITFNPFVTNGLSHPYQLGESIFIF